MNKLVIFILFSLAVLTLVGLALIPALIIPEDNSPLSFRATKKQASEASNCDLAVYGLDCNLVSYLENNIAWKAKDGKDFCSYKLFNSGDTQGIYYGYYSCSEFYASNGIIYEGSGAVGPIKLTSTAAGFVSLLPRDGSLFYQDVNEIFPEQYRRLAQSPGFEESEKLAQINRERARLDFGADFSYKTEKVTETACAHDFECQTPGEWLLMSRCPFTSMCLAGKCAVICPNFRENINFSK